ncbi:hypothetical protein MNBD_GAMMA07-2664 [hydrothermal vent metagenome]|uniref:Iron-binding zinc finger CDGSH type domain-containing protein n=1 Tax=hydrothermal vent metagenome TaxID=652676 RepID=A0A3B0X5R0_9ZZZZ
MSTDEKIIITPSPDGPYIVKNLINFSNQKGAIKVEKVMALCCCGKSLNKPYCDGTHAKIGFTNKNQQPKLENKCDNYVGVKITIHDNRRICAHAGVCTDNLASVFRMKKDPWINPDAADVKDIMEVIQNCPSGALSYTFENVAFKNNIHEPAIFIVPNGPYVVTGDVELMNTEMGEAGSKQQYTLCRCGASKNKPFCDGSHWGIEFKDDDN